MAETRICKSYPETTILGGRSVFSDPQHKEGHVVELATSSDAEAESAHSST